jgi:hypothetical protein
VKLRIDLGVEPDADAAELDDATRTLRRELLELDVETVERPSGGPAPAGTRAVDAALLGTLLVTAADELVGAVIQRVLGWLGRRASRSVKLEIDGDSIELTNPSAEEERKLVATFLARHGATSK